MAHKAELENDYWLRLWAETQEKLKAKPSDPPPRVGAARKAPSP